MKDTVGRRTCQRTGSNLFTTGKKIAVCNGNNFVYGKVHGPAHSVIEAYQLAAEEEVRNLILDFIASGKSLRSTVPEREQPLPVGISGTHPF